MPTITVVRPFMLQLDPKAMKDPSTGQDLPLMGLPEKIVFVPGVHETTDEIASHWYTKMHLAGWVEPPKGPGTAEFQAADMQTSPAIDPAVPSQPAPQDASNAPRAAAPPPSATRSTPRG